MNDSIICFTPGLSQQRAAGVNPKLSELAEDQGCKPVGECQSQN
jgi:hypothetical protein